MNGRVFRLHFLPLFLCGVILSARGEEAPARPPEGSAPAEREFRHRMPPHEMSPEERAAWREERRQRREAWKQMSPEERRQLRRDIREAGDAIYPPRRHREFAD